MGVKSLDHVVLTVKDIDATVAFYIQRLGMQHETFQSNGAQRHALKFGNQKINLHLSGHEFEPKAGRVQPGSADLCFITDDPIDDVLASWKSAGIEGRLLEMVRNDTNADSKGQVLEGGKVVERTGAVGKLKSIYCRDPDSNLIEYEMMQSERRPIRKHADDDAYRVSNYI